MQKEYWISRSWQLQHQPEAYRAQLNLRFGDINKAIIEEKSKFVELLRIADTNKRENMQNMEIERSRYNSVVSEVKDLISAQTNEKLEKVREDIFSRFKDFERVFLSFILLSKIY